MRIRLPFAGVFTLLVLLSAYVGLSPNPLPSAPINDKILHLLTFFLLSLAFYWILDTSRRRTLNFTLIVCTLCLGIGSEFLQALIPNGRVFDVYDVVANVVGSLTAIGLCSVYHKRMLERKRKRRTYSAVPGEDVEGEEDLELGESVGVGSAAVDGQEEGVTSVERGQTLEEELDNWDENAVDAWNDADDDDLGDIGAARSSKDEGKRAD